MKFALVSALLSGIVPALAQQNTAARWQVEIPPPIANTTDVKPAPKPQPPASAVLKSRVMRVPVTEAPELAGLPPITGVVNVTVKLVEDPGLPDPPNPLPPSPPTDPEIIARLNELRQNHKQQQIVFLSATVYEGPRTLLRIYPNGQAEKSITAWSNIDFNYFSGLGFYRVKEPDGTFHDCSLLMGIGYGGRTSAEAIARRNGKTFQTPESPQLPDLKSAGPSFVVVSGEQSGEAMDTLEQLHDLYRTEGNRLEEVFEARKKATEERRAFLLANPPKPQDFAIHVWKRKNPVGAEQGQEGGEQ